jgi:hypothetical protein
VEEAELRRRWEEMLGIGDADLLDQLWALLGPDEIEDAFKVGVTGVRDLAESESIAGLVEWYRRSKAGTSPPPKGSVPVRIELSEEDRGHAEALAHHLAKRAALQPEVARFRESVLGGGPLSADEPGPVRRFLTNELDPEDLPRVDPAYHPEFLDEVDDLKHLIAGGVVPPASAVYPYRLPAYPVPGGDAIDVLRGDAEFVYPYRSGVMELIGLGAREGSLGDLGRLIAAAYPWEPGDAAWFVLTGQTPEVAPLTLSHDAARGTFTLTFAPWISKGTILRARRLARALSGGGELKDKTLDVFMFVTERTEPEGAKPWEKLLAEWNRSHPDERYKNRSSIASAYRRAERKLAGLWTDVLEVRAPEGDHDQPDFWPGG